MSRISFLLFITVAVLIAEEHLVATEPIKVQSVRNILSEHNSIEHTDGQLRTGYISFSEKGQAGTHGYALGGHFHLDSRRWYGLKLGGSVYAVFNLGLNQKPLDTNGNFFNEDQNSFMLLSQAFLDGQWGNSKIKLGRQTLNTPHVDSDDVGMMPNFFTAYTITNNDIADLTLFAGLIDKMAGEGNGVDNSDFVDVGETLGTRNINGIYYVSAVYEGIQNLSLSFWYYHYSDIANVMYAEAGYQYAPSQNAIFTLGLQYSYSQNTGTALLGKQDAQTYGISMKGEFDTMGLILLAAYNQDNGNTGATGVSLGGDPFFTSMEDQGLDALETAGSSWMFGVGYDLEKLGIKGLTFGLAYGHFEADDPSLYKAREVDAVLEYVWSETFNANIVFASIKHKVEHLEDYEQFRFIGNYNF